MMAVVRTASAFEAEEARIIWKTMKPTVTEMATRPVARGSNEGISSEMWFRY
jgi:hypothetical protein